MFRPSTYRRVAAACVLLLCLGSCAYAHAQHKYQSSRDPWTIAKDAYRQQQWDKARHYTAAAAQRDPTEPRYYLSLARIAFQQGKYDHATWFYDLFIRTAQKSPTTYTGIYAVKRARAERKSANARRKNPDTKPEEPNGQQRVRHALLEHLSNGPVIRDDGGGALATFESLLRMGYANPDITTLRAKVDNAATKEADRRIASGHGRIPVLTYRQWKQQARRYNTTGQLIPAAVPFDTDRNTRNAKTDAPKPTAALAHEYFAEGQTQYLLQNWHAAETLFHKALHIAPSMSLAHQGLINALLQAKRPNRGALKQAIDDFHAVLPDDPALTLYVPLVKAAIGDFDGAAQELRALLTQDDNAP